MLPFPQIDPIAFSLGPFAVRWYALAYIVGLLFALWYMKRLVSNPALWPGTKPSASPHQLDDLFIWGVLGVVIGGRVGYVLFYKPAFFLENPLEILKVWGGGMSFHGGFLGVVVACLWWGRRHGVTLDRLLDLAAAAVPIGLGLGRIANFINGELWGRPSTMPWAMIFPSADAGIVPRHPSQLYEAALEGIVLFVVLRIATHHFKVLIKPGLASGIFALGYAFSRILVEFFREPDANLGYLAGPLTMGMLLSLPLIAVGVWLILRARNNARKIA